MDEKNDEYNALRQIVALLGPFDEITRSQILKWACEKLNISLTSVEPNIQEKISSAKFSAPFLEVSPQPQGDIKLFTDGKKPKSDNQFVTLVAYFYQFEARSDDRKDAIDGADVQEACRLVGRGRLLNPTKTLNNAYMAGYLQKSGNGKYKLSTVGENLIAMVLPGGDVSTSSKSQRNKSSSKKISKKK